jgi:cell division septation protein DedD
MLFKVLTVAVFAAVVAPIGAYSQSIAQIGGPAELPPSSYKGLQYVDSRGCVFMRVESSGTARWYPRVNAGRRPVCNQVKPGSIDVASEAPMAAPAPAPMMAPAPVVRTTPAPLFARTPMPTIASRMMPEAQARPAPVMAPPMVVAERPAPYVEHAPANSYERVAASGPGPGKIGCYTNAPVAEVVRLRNGGTAVMCTRGDGTSGGWRPPIYPAGSRPGVALRDPVQVTRGTVNAGGVEGYGTRTTRSYAQAVAPVIAPPPGYKLAWKDDRLNPLRGVGTAQGQADQDQIWTRKVPARLVADVARKKAARSTVTISTMNAPVKAARAGGGRAFVQVGTFGVASNASGAAARLRAAGLPVATSKLVKGGKVLQIVLAGPFGSAGEAQAALSSARRAGFGDAFLR